MLRAFAATLVLLACLISSSPGAACPDCAVGRQARSEVWTDHLAMNLLYALAPFLVIGAICVRLEANDRTRERPHNDKQDVMENP